MLNNPTRLDSKLYKQTINTSALTSAGPLGQLVVCKLLPAEPVKLSNIYRYDSWEFSTNSCTLQSIVRESNFAEYKDYN